MKLSRKALEKLAKIWALRGSPLPGEAKAAERAILEFLHTRDLTLADLPALEAKLKAAGLVPTDKPDDDGQDDPTAAANEDDSGDPAALGLHIIDLIRKYIDLAEHEYMAVALWILHTHVFDYFMYSPRLVLTSPAPECGKTELLSICELLSWNARRIDNTSAAYLYDLAHTEHPTLLLDEGDNAEITPGSLLAFILSGHRRGAIFGRGVGPNRKNYKTFGAVAFAKIGMDLPPALALRSFIIRMQRNVRPLKKLTREDLAPAGETDFTRTYRLIRRWAHKVSPSLSQDPPIPSELRGRQGDNWTAPLSIANTFGAMFGEAARQAAVVFAHRSRGDSIRVAALEDCCRVIAAAGVDRMPSEEIAARFVALDRGWDSYQGLRGAQPPHPIKTIEIAPLLREFLKPDGTPVESRSIWVRKGSALESKKGFYREDLENAWRRFCERGSEQPAGAKIIRALRRP
jgi:hypothetical protein